MKMKMANYKKKQYNTTMEDKLLTSIIEAYPCFSFEDIKELHNNCKSFDKTIQYCIIAQAYEIPILKLYSMVMILPHFKI